MADSLSAVIGYYSEHLPDWEKMRDSYKGQRAVKKKTSVYLPATANQITDGFPLLGSLGTSSYNAYLMRARYPNFLREAVQMAIGMMHSQPANFTLPKSMEGIKGTNGESLYQILRRINTEQLITGRIGLLLDLPVRAPIGQDIPYISTYTAEKIRNWDDGFMSEFVPQRLNLVVLDEKEMVRKDNFTWEEETRYRVLSLGDLDAATDGEYRFGVFKEDNFSPLGLKKATYRGKSLTEIPFIFINPSDLISEPDDPPLLDLGNLCMTIYMGEADYRQNLFMQGQDTFVTIGGSFDDFDTVRTGAGTRIDLPMGGDAKYEGVSSNGLQEQREALESDRARAGSMGAQTMDTVSRERESGASLNIRMAARTADLTQIAMTGAQGLERLLKIAATWMGENPEEVKVEPNLEFNNTPLTGQTMVEMQTARNLGFPISARTLHTVAVDRGMTKMTYEEELAEAVKEKTTEFGVKEEVDLNPTNDPKINKGPKDIQKEKTGGATK